MNKKYYYIRITVTAIIGILSVLAFTKMFYPLPIFDIQLTALLQRTLLNCSLFTAILLAGLLIITLLFGRIYCSTLCPLGLYQELLMLLFRRKNSVQKNKPYKYFLAAIVFGALISGTSYLVRLIDPYTLFGSALSGAWLGLAVLAILAVLVWFKGRLFCANICPVGMLLGLISKHAVNKMYINNDKCISCGLCAAKCPTGSIDFKNKIINNETCIKCFKCLGTCRRNGINYGIKPAAPAPFNPARRQLLIGGAVIAAFALAAKGGINLSKAVTANIKRVIIPAGAESAEKFANHCLNCNLCVQNCPMKVLKKANSNYPAVHLDYTDSFCDYDCNKCSQVCPSGAIKRLSLAQKQKTQIGLANIDEQICVKCGLCIMKCPRQAVSKKGGAFPIVDADQCIGCGTCANGCPVKAITIQPLQTQKTLAK